MIRNKKHLFGKPRLFLNIFSLYFQIWGLFLSKPFVAESGAQVVERNQWKGLETLWFTMPEEEFLGFQGGLVGSSFRAMYGWPRLMVLVYVKMFFSSQFLANTLQGLMDIPCVSERFKFCSTSKRGILGTCPTLWDWMGWESLSQHCYNVYVELPSRKRPKPKMTLVFPPSIFRCKLLVWGWVSKDTLQTWGFRNHSIPQIHRWTKEGATQRDHRREAKRIWWFTGWRGLVEKMVECFAGFHEAFPWTLEKLQVFDSWDSEPHHLIIQSFCCFYFQPCY